jgi:hypothetical protein
MFKLDRPSMAVNDPRVSSGGFMQRFQMENSWDIAAGESRQHIIDWVAAVASKADGGKLKNLVLNCHGLPAYLQLRQGFDGSQIPMFAAWNGLVEKIWLPVCLVAQIPTPAQQSQYNATYPTMKTGDGNVFCSRLAKTAGCYVIASTEMQCDALVTVPVDQMTSFEGLILSYGPDGNISWSSRNPSIWVNGGGMCVRVPD